MNRTKAGARARAAAAAIALAVIATGCAGTNSSTPASGDLPDCPKPAPALVEVLTSDSPLERSQTIQDARLQEIRHAAQLAASCNAPLLVKLYSGQTRTAVIWNGPVRHSAGTQTAMKNLTNRDITTTVLPAVQQSLSHELTQPAPKNMSPAGMFQVLHDDHPAPGQPVIAVLLSDFVPDTNGTNLNRPLSADDVNKTVATTTVPTLSHTDTVTIHGIADTSEQVPAPDDWIASIRKFAADLCNKTGATCQESTQYQQ